MWFRTDDVCDFSFQRIQLGRTISCFFSLLGAEMLVVKNYIHRNTNSWMLFRLLVAVCWLVARFIIRFVVFS